MKRFTEEIEAHIQNIPDWTEETAVGPAALLSLNLRQYLLVLHDRQIRQADTTAERNFSRMMLIDTATKIIDTHRTLIDKGSHALQILCNDHLRAALSICHVASTVDLKADSAISQIIEHHADKVMDEVIQMLTDKVIRFGREQRLLWVAIAAHGFWKAKKNPGERAVYMQEAVDKVTGPYYKIMACQEEGPVALAALPGSAAKEGRVGDLPNGFNDYLPLVPQQQKADATVPEFADPPLLDLDDIEAWTFENWAFNPMELQQAFADPYPPVVP